MPLPVVVNQHTDITVQRFIGLALLDQQPRVTTRTDSRHEGLARQMVAHDVLHHGLKHRDFNFLAFARARPGNDGGKNGVRPHQANRAVRQRQRHIARLTARRAGHQVRHGASALNQVVICGLASVWAAFAVAIQPRVNNAGIVSLQPFVMNPQTLHRLRPDVVNHDVCRACQAVEGFKTFGFLQVEHQASFVAIDVQENGAHARVAHRTNAPHGVACRRFDLHHVGAHVCHELRGIGPHQHGGEVQHTQTFQRTSHLFSLVSQ